MKNIFNTIFNNAFNKDIFREIKNTLDRFFGIFAIIALGVSFFVGIGSTGTRMKFVEDKYLDEQNLMDIRVVSNYGLNENDITSISEVAGVQKVYPSYTIDAHVQNKDNSLILKVHSFDAENQVNKPYLISGTLPTKGNETAVEDALLKKLDVQIGDTITLDSGKKVDIRTNLKIKTYKIVGIIKSPYYISTERGNGTIGNGKIDCYIIIPKENFLQKVYSEAFVVVESAMQLFCFDTEYEDTIDNVVTKLESLELIRVKKRANEMTKIAFENINKQKEIVKNKKQESTILFDETEQEFISAKTQADNSSYSLSEYKTNINKNLEQINILSEKMNTSLYDIEVGLNTLKDRKVELQENQITLNDSKTLLEEKELELKENEQLAISSYPSDSSMLKDSLFEIENAKYEISNSKAELNELDKQIEENLIIIDSSIADLEVQNSSVVQSVLEIQETKKQLEISLQDIYQSETKISENKSSLSKNINSFYDTKNKTLLEIEQSEKILAEKVDILNDIEEPDWYILDRESNAGFLSYREDSDKIEAIGRVFPLFFFLVAALICLTTMTRLVEERRTEIGTLKSLGYTSSKILSKYVIYATIPTLIGGVFGGYIGMIVYPNVIINAYNNLYTIPKSELLLDYPLWFVGIFIGVLTTITSSVYTCINELKENPAHILRPKAPKVGKRNIFEYFTFFWSRLSFTKKVTVRNILRNKKRFFMTTFGIGGCTALLVTGFGIKNSVSDLATKQFGQIFMYDVKTTFTDDSKKKDITYVMNKLITTPITKESIIVHEKSMDVQIPTGNTEKFTLIIPQTIDNFHKFIKLQERVSKKPITIQGDSIIINEKLSVLLNVGVGDEITIKDGNEITIKATVTDICENYFMNYIYMNETHYKQLFNEEVDYNVIYTLLNKNVSASQSGSLSNEILDKKNVSSVAFLSASKDQFSGTVDSLNIVILVLVVSAGALVFIVLFNLTNINISERIRELATIEVLGFRDKEVEAYVYRENIVLTIAGILLGLLLGYFLHLYVILTVESRLMMFSRAIWLSSYIYATVITAIFSFGVNKLTSRKLKTIDMVEALKSVE